MLVLASSVKRFIFVRFLIVFRVCTESGARLPEHWIRQQLSRVRNESGSVRSKQTSDCLMMGSDYMPKGWETALSMAGSPVQDCDVVS